MYWRSVWVHCRLLLLIYCSRLNFGRIICLWNISDEEDNEEEHLSVSDDVVPPSSDGSCPSVKSPGCGDAGESDSEAPHSDSRTCESVTTEKPQEDNDTPSFSNGRSRSGVPNPPSGEDVPLISNSCPSADSNGIGEVTESPQNCVSTALTTPTSHPKVTNETCNKKKRKRESKTNHTILQNGTIRRSHVR